MIEVFCKTRVHLYREGITVATEFIFLRTNKRFVRLRFFLSTIITSRQYTPYFYGTRTTDVKFVTILLCATGLMGPQNSVTVLSKTQRVGWLAMLTQLQYDPHIKREKATRKH